MRTATAALLLLVSGAFPGPSIAQSPTAVRDPTEHYFAAGGAVLPPRGDGWVVDRGADYVMFGRQAGSKTHTCVASVEGMFIAKLPPTADSLRKVVIQTLAVGKDRPKMRQIALEVVRDSTFAPLCFRYRLLCEDRGVPHYEGKRFMLRGQGIRLIHPQAPTVMIAVDYNERWGPGDNPEDSTEASAFLESFRTTLRDTTAGEVLPGRLDAEAVAVGHGSVWVGRRRYTDFEGEDARNSDEIVRIDPTTHAVVARIRVANGPLGIAFSPDAVWVTSGNDKHPGIQRIDAAENRLTATLEFGKQPYRAEFGGGSVWVSDPGAGKVWRVDAQSCKLVGNGTPGLKSPCGLAYARDQLWVADVKLRQLLSIDPVSGKIVGTPIGVGAEAYVMVAGAGSLWVLSEDMHAVQRVDPERRTVVTTIPLSLPGPAAVTFANGSVWVADYQNGSLVRIDPQTNRVAGPVMAAGVSLRRLAASDSTLWVADRMMGALIAIPY